MRVKIQAVSGDVRTDKYTGKLNTGVKFNDKWYSMAGDMRHLRNQDADIELDKNGKWAQLIEQKPPVITSGQALGGGGSGGGDPPSLPPIPTTNGKIPWADCKDMILLAHTLACQLEPDGVDEDLAKPTDRSQARCAIVNTVMIAFTKGLIALPPVMTSGTPDDDYPWPEGVK